MTTRSPVFLLHVAGVAVALAMAWYAVQNRRYPGVSWFVAWSICTATWVGLNAVGFLVVDPGTRTIVQSLALGVVPFTSTAWFVFAVEYTGRGDVLTRRRRSVLAVLAVGLSSVTVTNPLHGRIVADLTIDRVAGVAAVTTFEPSLGFWAVNGYAYLLFFAGLALLVTLVITGDRLYLDQAAALVFAGGLPLVTAIVVVGGQSPVPIDLTPLASAVSSVPLAYAVFRSQLLDLIPAFHRVGERQAVYALDQGVLVLDPADRVAVANPRIATILHADQEDVRNRPIASVLEESRLEPTSRWIEGTSVRSSAERGHSEPDRDDAVPSRLRDPATGRVYAVTRSPIEGDGTELGRTLVFRDITEERRRKQRLLVLNRVVRHNLRNDMTVLLGHARMLGGEDDESLRVIEEIGSDLVRLGEKAQEIDGIIRESADEDRPVDVAGIVERVTERYRDTHPDVAFDVRVPEQAWTESHGRVIEAIVSNLVENAVEHGRSTHDDGPHAPTVQGSVPGGTSSPTDGGTARSSDAPEVTVVVEHRSDRLQLVVADDGPGIPEEELETVLDGEITDLHHSSGLGLWMVKWCADLADACLDVDTTTGTRVTVSFRRTDAARSPDDA